MDKLTSYCDECGRPKGETNHWWKLEANIQKKSMFISPLEIPTDNFPKDRYIQLKACGLECLAKLESKIKEGVNPLK